MSALHPFERAGMGCAPFKFVGVYSLPSPTLAEHNPDAYRNALAAMPRGFHCGTCACCGMAIMNNYLIVSADGQKYSVGCECVYKTNDRPICDAVKKAAAEARRQKLAARREEKRATRLAEWRDKNAERIAEREAAQAERERIAEETRHAARARWSFVIPVLKRQAGQFCASIVQSIENGQAPRGRAITIIGEIYAKENGGRKGSKAYLATLGEFNEKIDSANVKKD